MPEEGPESLRLTPEQLARINRVATIARFVAGLAHEMNNSLQIIGGLVELLGDRADLPADAALRVGKVGAQADRAGAAIRQVLAFVRDPGGDRRTVDLGSIVDRALALSGGAGYMARHPLAKAWRDVRAGGFMHPVGANRVAGLLARTELGVAPDEPAVA